MLQLGCAIPESGGEFAYLKAAYGDAVGFLFTWNCALVAKPASCRSALFLWWMQIG
jgi:amino acid transporter